MNLGIKIIGLLGLLTSAAVTVSSDDKPNIILIVTDDQGYMDVGFNGGKQIPTPNIDRIANEGVRFDQGYVSYPVCGPSRAGFLTGRYQDRFGFTTNPTMDPSVKSAGLPVEEDLISEVLKKVGYTNMAVGKWHMGVRDEYHPMSQGFDEFFGFLSGGHQYMPEVLTLNSFEEVTSKYGWYYTRLLQNKKRVDIHQYLTDELSDQAVDFVEREKDNPFFLYLAYNAPHAPLQATEKYLKRFKHIKDKRRRTYAAMVSSVDDGVGKLLDKLDKLGIADNTLIFFLSDNGGPLDKNASDNGVLRAGKGSMFEGGLRVPFAMRWPAKIKAGIDYKRPISSLDILATAAAASNAPLAKERPLDGVNIVPFVTGEKKGQPHEILFWRDQRSRSNAVRFGDMKMLVRERKSENKAPILFDIANDISEKNDLSSSNPAIMKKLLAIRDEWEAQMKEPAFPKLGSWKPWLKNGNGPKGKKKKSQKKNKKNKKNK